MPTFAHKPKKSHETKAVKSKATRPAGVALPAIVQRKENGEGCPTCLGNLGVVRRAKRGVSDRVKVPLL